MCSLIRWSSSSSVILLALGMTASAVTPIMISKTASAQATAPNSTPYPDAPSQAAPSPSTAANFSDVPADYWARPFIQALATRNIIAGFPDGTFGPEQPVDRAEFAAMIQKAFAQKQVRQLSEPGFKDVPADYWGAAAIEAAYEAGFMDGYPSGTFQPNQEINKVQAIATLASGLDLTTAPDSIVNTLRTYYTDYLKAARVLRPSRQGGRR